MPMIDTELCLECGVNTNIDGYVNRIPRDREIIDGYNCGRCQETWDDAVIWYDNNGNIVGRGEDEDPRFDEEGEEVENGDLLYERGTDDEMEAKYEKKRWAEVDAMFPDAPAFREWCEKDTNGTLTKEDQEQVQALVKNYRFNKAPYEKKINQWITAGGVLENLLRK